MKHVAYYALLILSGACSPEAPNHSAPKKLCRGQVTDEWQADENQAKREMMQAGSDADRLQRPEDYARFNEAVNRHTARNRLTPILICRTTRSAKTAQATWALRCIMDEATLQAVGNGHRLPDEYYCDECKIWIQKELLSDTPPGWFDWIRL